VAERSRGYFPCVSLKDSQPITGTSDDFIAMSSTDRINHHYFIPVVDVFVDILASQSRGSTA
jgi:hypothetical protein